MNRVRQLPGVTVDVFEPAELAMLNLNITQPPFNDIRVRQAHGACGEPARSWRAGAART